MSFWRRKTVAPQADMTAAMAPPQPARRTYAIGDIHGCLDKLYALLALIEEDLHSGVADIVFLGDYVDRGDDSKGVLTLLRQLQTDSPNDVHCLLGNHDRMLLNFIEDPAGHMRWLGWGGQETLASFGVFLDTEGSLIDRMARLGEETREAVGPDLLQWLAARPLWWRSGSLIAVHAMTDPALPMEQQTEEFLLWERPRSDQRPREDGAWVVHGHTIVTEPDVRSGHVAIDTGAFSGGPLTAAVFDGTAPRFLATI